MNDRTLCIFSMQMKKLADNKWHAFFSLHMILDILLVDKSRQFDTDTQSVSFRQTYQPKYLRNHHENIPI